MLNKTDACYGSPVGSKKADLVQQAEGVSAGVLRTQPNAALLGTNLQPCHTHGARRLVVPVRCEQLHLRVHASLICPDSHVISLSYIELHSS